MPHMLVSCSRWSLDIYRMSSQSRQQEALRVFSQVAMPGVEVLGVVRDDEAGTAWFIVVDSIGVSGAIRSGRVLVAVDPLAVRSHRNGSRRRTGLFSGQRVDPPGDEGNRSSSGWTRTLYP